MSPCVWLLGSFQGPAQTLSLQISLLLTSLLVLISGLLPRDKLTVLNSLSLEILPCLAVMAGRSISTADFHLKGCALD